MRELLVSKDNCMLCGRLGAAVRYFPCDHRICRTCYHEEHSAHCCVVCHGAAEAIDELSPAHSFTNAPHTARGIPNPRTVRATAPPQDWSEQADSSLLTRSRTESPWRVESTVATRRSAATQPNRGVTKAVDPTEHCLGRDKDASDSKRQTAALVKLTAVGRITDAAVHPRRLSLSPDGAIVAVLDEALIRLHRLSKETGDYAPLCIIRLPQVSSMMQCSPCSRYVAACLGAKVALFRATTGATGDGAFATRLVGILDGHTAPVNSICFLGPETVATGSSDGSVMLWKIPVSRQKDVEELSAKMDSLRRKLFDSLPPAASEEEYQVALRRREEARAKLHESTHDVLNEVLPLIGLHIPREVSGALAEVIFTETDEGQALPERPPTPFPPHISETVSEEMHSLFWREFWNSVAPRVPPLSRCFMESAAKTTRRVNRDDRVVFLRSCAGRYPPSATPLPFGNSSPATAARGIPAVTAPLSQHRGISASTTRLWRWMDFPLRGVELSLPDNLLTLHHCITSVDIADDQPPKLAIVVGFSNGTIAFVEYANNITTPLSSVVASVGESVEAVCSTEGEASCLVTTVSGSQFVWRPLEGHLVLLPLAPLRLIGNLGVSVKDNQVTVYRASRASIAEVRSAPQFVPPANAPDAPLMSDLSVRVKEGSEVMEVLCHAASSSLRVYESLMALNKLRYVNRVVDALLETATYRESLRTRNVPATWERSTLRGQFLASLEEDLVFRDRRRAGGESIVHCATGIVETLIALDTPLEMHRRALSEIAFEVCDNQSRLLWDRLWCHQTLAVRCGATTEEQMLVANLFSADTATCTALLHQIAPFLLHEARSSAKSTGSAFSIGTEVKKGELSGVGCCQHEWLAMLCCLCSMAFRCSVSEPSDARCNILVTQPSLKYAEDFAQFLRSFDCDRKTRVVVVAEWQAKAQLQSVEVGSTFPSGVDVIIVDHSVRCLAAPNLQRDGSGFAERQQVFFGRVTSTLVARMLPSSTHYFRDFAAVPSLRFAPILQEVDLFVPPESISYRCDASIPASFGFRSNRFLQDVALILAAVIADPSSGDVLVFLPNSRLAVAITELLQGSGENADRQDVHFLLLSHQSTDARNAPLPRRVSAKHVVFAAHVPPNMRRIGAALDIAHFTRVENVCIAVKSVIDCGIVEMVDFCERTHRPVIRSEVITPTERAQRRLCAAVSGHGGRYYYSGDTTQGDIDLPNVRTKIPWLAGHPGVSPMYALKIDGFLKEASVEADAKLIYEAAIAAAILLNGRLLFSLRSCERHFISWKRTVAEFITSGPADVKCSPFAAAQTRDLSFFQMQDALAQVSFTQRDLFEVLAPRSRNLQPSSIDLEAEAWLVGLLETHGLMHYATRMALDSQPQVPSAVPGESNALGGLDDVLFRDERDTSLAFRMADTAVVGGANRIGYFFLAEQLLSAGESLELSCPTVSNILLPFVAVHTECCPPVTLRPRTEPFITEAIPVSNTFFKMWPPWELHATVRVRLREVTRADTSSMFLLVECDLSTLMVIIRAETPFALHKAKAVVDLMMRETVSFASIDRTEVPVEGACRAVVGQRNEIHEVLLPFQYFQLRCAREGTRSSRTPTLLLRQSLRSAPPHTMEYCRQTDSVVLRFQSSEAAEQFRRQVPSAEPTVLQSSPGIAEWSECRLGLMLSISVSFPTVLSHEGLGLTDSSAPPVEDHLGCVVAALKKLCCWVQEGDDDYHAVIAAAAKRNFQWSYDSGSRTLDFYARMLCGDDDTPHRLGYFRAKVLRQLAVIDHHVTVTHSVLCSACIPVPWAFHHGLPPFLQRVLHTTIEAVPQVSVRYVTEPSGGGSLLITSIDASAVCQAANHLSNVLLSQVTLDVELLHRLASEYNGLRCLMRSGTIEFAEQAKVISSSGLELQRFCLHPWRGEVSYFYYDDVNKHISRDEFHAVMEQAVTECLIALAERIPQHRRPLGNSNCAVCLKPLAGGVRLTGATHALVCEFCLVEQIYLNKSSPSFEVAATAQREGLTTVLPGDLVFISMPLLIADVRARSRAQFLARHRNQWFACPAARCYGMLQRLPNKRLMECVGCSAKCCAACSEECSSARPYHSGSLCRADLWLLKSPEGLNELVAFYAEQLAAVVERSLKRTKCPFCHAALSEKRSSVATECSVCSSFHCAFCLSVFPSHDEVSEHVKWCRCRTCTTVEQADRVAVAIDRLVAQERIDKLDQLVSCYIQPLKVREALRSHLGLPHRPDDSDAMLSPWCVALPRYLSDTHPYALPCSLPSLGGLSVTVDEILRCFAAMCPSPKYDFCRFEGDSLPFTFEEGISNLEALIGLHDTVPHIVSEDESDGIKAVKLYVNSTSVHGPLNRLLRDRFLMDVEHIVALQPFMHYLLSGLEEIRLASGHSRAREVTLYRGVDVPHEVWARYDAIGHSVVWTSITSCSTSFFSARRFTSTAHPRIFIMRVCSHCVVNVSDVAEYDEHEVIIFPRTRLLVARWEDHTIHLTQAPCEHLLLE